MKIAILIPCLNEEMTIEQVIFSFRESLPEADIYVFDNNSEDNTAKKAETAGAILQKVSSRGKGRVVIEMFRKVEADYFVMVDGDNTYPAEMVKELLKPIISGECDMVVGKRVPAEGASPFPKFHKLGNIIIIKIINSVFKSNLCDVFSGYRAFNQKIVRSLPLLSKGFEIETELTLQALDKNFTVKEIEIPYRERPPGSHSKLNTYLDGLLVIKTILSVIKDYKPLGFFSIVGLFSFLLSIGFGSINIEEYLRTQHVYHPSTAVLAVGLMLVSLLSLTTGLILDSVKRHYAEQYSLYINQMIRSENKNDKRGINLNSLQSSPSLDSPALFS